MARAGRDWTAAEQQLGEAIRHTETVYGRGSVRVASLLYLVALLFRDKGWAIYAEGLFKKAIDIYDAHRYRSRDSIALIQDYAAMLRKLERSSEAQRLLEQFNIPPK